MMHTAGEPHATDDRDELSTATADHISGAHIDAGLEIQRPILSHSMIAQGVSGMGGPDQERAPSVSLADAGVERSQLLDVRSRRSQAAALLALCSLFGCGAAARAGVQASIDELEQRQRAADAQLQTTLAAIAEAEHREQIAAKQAAAAQCRAQVMGLAAEAAEHLSRCSLARASVAQCQAKVAKAQADNTILGCLFGIGASVVSGGAAAPLAMAGCGLGRLAGQDEIDCATGDGAAMDCSERGAQRVVLQAHGLPTIPMCGGEFGAVLGVTSATGIHVEEVISGTTADSIGMLRDDVLISVNDLEVVDAAGLARALAAAGGGGSLRVRALRAGEFVSLTGSLKGDKLGIVIGASEEVPSAFLHITTVTAGSGAERANLLPGDRLLRIGPTSVDSVATAYGLLALADEGTTIALTYERTGRLKTTTVTLGPRSSPYAF